MIQIVVVIMNKKFKQYRFKLFQRMLHCEKQIKRLEKRQMVYYEKEFRDYTVSKSNYDRVRKWIIRYNNSLNRLYQLWPLVKADNSSCEK